MNTPPSSYSNPYYLGSYAADALATIRFACVGMGRRAAHLLHLLGHLEGVEIVAICDLDVGRAEEAAEVEETRHGLRPALYTEGPTDYQRMLAEVRPDAVLITVGWEHHADVACAAMENGAHAFVEVPLATSIAELWRIIHAAEKHQRHCMMMENANYGREELLFLNMVRKGVIGEPVHAEAAYIHDLRFSMDEEVRNEATWRTKHYLSRNGNLYPTHGLGPVSQYMNLERGEDSFSRLSSFSSVSRGRQLYAKKHFDAEHKWNKNTFICGDVNTSVIQTELGRTILLQWDECSLRPRTRHNFIQGTEGVLAGFPTRVIAECLGCPEHSDWLQGEALEAVFARYDHPLWRRLGARAEELAGERARDYIMLSRIVDCLHQGLPLDQNVYEGATWSAVAELTELSVEKAGASVSFPDFTRGDWKRTPGLGIAD